jgi:hypothetical protein
MKYIHLSESEARLQEARKKFDSDVVEQSLALGMEE